MNLLSLLNLHPDASGSSLKTENDASSVSFANPGEHASAEVRVVVTIQEEIAFRPIAPGDEPEMVRFHSQLSDESVYLRYFDHASIASRTQPERLRQVCTNSDESFAILAEKKMHREALPEILAVGRLTLTVPANFAVAEFALLLRDEDALGAALAKLLLERLIILAREFGFKKITAELLAADVGTVELCESLNFEVTHNSASGTVRVALGL